MISMKPYDLKDSFEVYKEAVERKDNGPVKTELKGIEQPMDDCYKNYHRHFRQNDLEYMPHSRVGTDHKIALLSLYGSQTKLIKDFRKRYFEINPQTYNDVCPYCVISESNTTEHILPKEKYPEYAVDVLNLIPGCSKCNSLKGEDVLNQNGERFIINYYTDILPNIQYLFVDIFFNGEDLGFRYRLENVGNAIDTGLFSLIDRHYTKLELLKRYKEKAIQTIAEIKNDYLSEGITDEQGYDTYAAKRRNKCELDVPYYGINHWKIVLMKAAADSRVFKEYILQKLGIA